MTEKERTALQTLLTCLGDDEFIIGHRMAEWTGQGPMIEEDIAFSSMAQDELGHALGYYTLLESIGGRTPDDFGFRRKSPEFRSAILVELPRGDFAFSIMRQLLYDAAESEWMTELKDSSFEPLADLASKIQQEERYHWIHDTGMVKRLSGGTEESRTRMQKALDETFAHAVGMFEEYEDEALLTRAGIAPAVEKIRRSWLRTVCPLLEEYGLKVSAHREEDEWYADVEPVTGGRTGKHTGHLDDILKAVQLLNREDPEAAW